MDRLLGTVFTVLPGIASPFVASWAGLLEGTYMMRPDVSPVAYRSSLALATILALATTMLCRHTAAMRLRSMSLSCLIVVILLSVLGFACATVLGYPRTKRFQIVATGVWDLASVLCVVSLVLGVVFATMYLQATSRTSS